MLETSKDILFIVLAFCALWLTVFLSWLLWYFIRIVRSIVTVVERVNFVVEKIDKAVDKFRDIMDRGSSHFLVLAELIKQGISFAKSRKEDFSKKRRTGKNKDEQEG